MNPHLEAFILEIEQLSAFIEAARSSPIWNEHLSGIERCFEGVSKLDHPIAVDLTDAAVRIVTSRRDAQPVTV